MSSSNLISLPSRRLRPTLLTAGLAAALGVALSAADAEPAPGGKLRRPAMSHSVTSCDDDGQGTLRAVIGDPMTGSGDTVDLTPLKTVCSTITLDSQIDVQQDTLLLQGPGSKYLTIDGGSHGRVFHHLGSGTLAIADLTVANGYYASDTNPVGGCIYSSENVSLIDSVVSHCTVKGTGNTAALGGGIFTANNLHLLKSMLSYNQALGTTVISGVGGGAYVLGQLQALYSTISNNTAHALGNAYGFAGGVEAAGNVDIEESTISRNQAEVGGALALVAGGAIMNSTVSSNTATKAWGGIKTNGPLTLANSTVAFNRSFSDAFGQGDGLYAEADLTLQSSIIADNAGPSGQSDVSGFVGTIINGADNLITQSTLALPMGTITDCPKLDVLADNGGHTLTHGLNPTSPAIDVGAAAMSLTIDQRLAPRVTGQQADLGAVEWRASDNLERILASGFDGLCDQ